MTSMHRTMLDPALNPDMTFIGAVPWTQAAFATPWQDIRAAAQLAGISAGTLYLNQATADVLHACTNPADAPALDTITIQVYDAGYFQFVDPAARRPRSRRSLNRHRKPGTPPIKPVVPPMHLARFLPDGRAILTDGDRLALIYAYPVPQP